MYSALPLHSLAVEAGGVDYQGSLDGTNLPGDACLVLSTDPKPRLRWTADLHERFVDAITQLGGPEKATPKTIMRTMGVKGLTLYHLKSHLQKYRLGKLASSKELTEISKDVSCVAESQDTGSSTSASSKMTAQDIHDGYQVTEALRVQMEVQRRLHEQLEVQQHLQIRIEAQSQYLQSILDKACKILDDQAMASAGLEDARKELSELAIKVANDCNGGLTVPLASHNNSDTDKNSIPYLPARLGECSIDSVVMSNGNPVSPSTLESPAAALKKRPRPLFSGGEMPLDSSMKPVEWMMSNFG